MYDPCMECLGAKGYVYVMPDGRISFTSPCGIGGKATTQVPPEGIVLGVATDPCHYFSDEMWRKVAEENMKGGI